MADFIGWSERVADAVTQGTSAQHVRSYLKTIAKETWQLVNWLTHAQNAVMYDAQLALDSTRNVLATFTTAVLRKEANVPDRCPVCSSYRIVTTLHAELDAASDYVATCLSCGWTADGAHAPE